MSEVSIIGISTWKLCTVFAQTYIGKTNRRAHVYLDLSFVGQKKGS